MVLFEVVELVVGGAECGDVIFDLLDSFLFQPFLQLNLKLLLNEKFKSLHLQNNPSVKLYSLLYLHFAAEAINVFPNAII